MILHIFMIAGPVIGLIIGLAIAFHDRHDYYTSWVWNSLIGLFFGFVVGFLLGLLVASGGASAAAEKNEYTNVETYDLVALATQQETEGSAGMLIFVGWGQVGETRTAYWTATDKDGITQMYSEEAMEIMVKETDSKPRYLVQEKIDDSGFWWPGDYGILRREILEVPVGTMTANYEFQP